VTINNRPDFTIIGGRFDGKVWLLASREIRRFELIHEEDYEEVRSWAYAEPIRTMMTRQHMEFRCTVRGYVHIVADTYAEAWARLFDNWTPPGRPELPGRKELT